MESLLLLLLAFYWLGHETKWLTVRLLVGKYIDYHKAVSVATLYDNWIHDTFQKRISWQVVQNIYCHGSPRTLPFWYKYSVPHSFSEFTATMQPLCGWEWLENTMHVVPETTLAVTYKGVTHTMTIKNPCIIKDVVEAMKAKPHPGNGKMHMKRNKLGGLVAQLPAKAH